MCFVSIHVLNNNLIIASISDFPVVDVEYQYPNGLVRSSLNGTQIVSLTEGDSVLLLCKPHSNPPAFVSWRRAGERDVWSTEREVLIEDVGRENAGIYTCTAHNTLGVSGPKEIVVDVKCKYDAW